MRSHLHRIVVAVVVIIAMAGPLRAQGDSARLVVLNRGYVDAFIYGRAAWYDAHLAPEFRCLCPDGSIVDRATFVDAAKQPMRNRSFDLDSVRVSLYGDVALITAVTPFVRADGTSGTNRYTDIWVKRGGDWKAVQAQITPVRGR
jgi:hypothetical protein